MIGYTISTDPYQPTINDLNFGSENWNFLGVNSFDRDDYQKDIDFTCNNETSKGYFESASNRREIDWDMANIASETIKSDTDGNLSQQQYMYGFLKAGMSMADSAKAVKDAKNKRNNQPVSKK